MTGNSLKFEPNKRITDWLESQDTEMVLDKYKQNLKVVGDYIYSYDTKVAWIDRYRELVQIAPKYFQYSRTTSKHINYVAKELGYPTRVYWYSELP